MNLEESMIEIVALLSGAVLFFCIGFYVFQSTTVNKLLSLPLMLNGLLLIFTTVRLSITVDASTVFFFMVLPALLILYYIKLKLTFNDKENR